MLFYFSKCCNSQAQGLEWEDQLKTSCFFNIFSVILCLVWRHFRSELSLLDGRGQGQLVSPSLLPFSELPARPHFPLPRKQVQPCNSVLMECKHKLCVTFPDTAHKTFPVYSFLLFPFCLFKTFSHCRILLLQKHKGKPHTGEITTFHHLIILFVKFVSWILCNYSSFLLHYFEMLGYLTKI